MAKDKNEGQVINTEGMDPALLAVLKAAMEKDGGKSLLKNVESVKKNELNTKIADKAYRLTASYMKEKFPDEYAKAYEWNKAVATELVNKG